jgi:predicted cobalt transporter CbtA
MRHRKRTAWIAAAWLSCQAIAFVLPFSANTIAAVAVDLCTCPGHVPGAPCPMHHHGLGTTDQHDGPAVRNACAQPDVALLSLAGGLGILPEPASLATDRVQTKVVFIATVPLYRTEVPDSPPPRA